MKFSEKRTYILNGEMIFITKVKKVQKDIKKGIEEHHLVTFENLNTYQVMTVKDDQLLGAERAIDSTEFFTMRTHYDNWVKRDPEYAQQNAIKFINHLKERSIEMNGKNKFEEYDENHLVRIYNEVYKTNHVYSDIHYMFTGE